MDRYFDFRLLESCWLQNVRIDFFSDFLIFGLCLQDLGNLFRLQYFSSVCRSIVYTCWRIIFKFIVNLLSTSRMSIWRFVESKFIWMSFSYDMDVWGRMDVNLLLKLFSLNWIVEHTNQASKTVAYLFSLVIDSVTVHRPTPFITTRPPRPPAEGADEARGRRGCCRGWTRGGGGELAGRGWQRRAQGRGGVPNKPRLKHE